jgi:protein involved in ribonucleotide reduction
MRGLKERAPVAPMLIQVEKTNLQLKERAESVLNKFNVKGTVLAVIPSGSKAYGTEFGDISDDYIGIYVAPLELVLSMEPPQTRVDELGVESEQKIAFSRGS